MAINIRGLDRARVLAALHAEAIPGALHGGYKNLPPIDPGEAERLLEDEQTFAYIEGRAMFVTFDGELVHTAEFDARNGAGAAERAIAPLLAEACGCGRTPTEDEDRALVREVLSEASGSR